jgi:hypothetical protein
MSFQIDQSLSLMIPRVFLQWTGEQAIIDIFHQQHIGRIYKVSIIRTPGTKKRGYPIYQAFLYFSAWYENEIAYHFQQRIFGHRGQARVVYDDPWFWVVFENTKRRLSNNDKRLIRLGAQDYQNEEAADAVEERVRSLENWQQAQEVQMEQQAERAEELMERQQRLEERQQKMHAHLNELAEVLINYHTRSLEETAIQVAEAALADEPAPAFVLSAAAPAFVFSPPRANEPRLLSTLSEEFVMRTIGAELALTETAISVAEAALYEDDDDVVPQWNGNEYNKNDYFPGEDW